MAKKGKSGKGRARTAKGRFKKGSSHTKTQLASLKKQRSSKREKALYGKAVEGAARMHYLRGSHVPLKTLKERAAKLNRIVAFRSKNPTVWK